MRFVIRIFWRN